ncbi:hypothetical protein CCB80_14325 [Armatimonadetes bacterium Uphvl-Ar1]|nr:hypothetical protein CCB80_14325 [Armatimonadetes bacterium Uphvl-Ar1]
MSPLTIHLVSRQKSLNRKNSPKTGSLRSNDRPRSPLNWIGDLSVSPRRICGCNRIPRHRWFFRLIHDRKLNARGVGIGEQDLKVVGLGLGVILCFVTGVAIGTVIASLSRRRQRSRVLFLVALFLAVGAFAWVFRVPHMGLVFIVMAMGAENAVFHRDGEPSIGLTYMTGVLVKMGQIIAGLFTGTPDGSGSNT